MARLLEETLRPLPGELREEAWSLLALRRQVTDRQVRKELAARAFELAQLASRLEFDGVEVQGKLAPSNEPSK